MNAHFVSGEKPGRQAQKLSALSKYVQKYPQGWKKRLELANLLCQMGNWQQAVAEYHQVIERQPHLIEVRLQLGKILQVMGRPQEAIDIYEQALSLSENQGTQHHIHGSIAVCRHESQQAIVAFNLAARLEPTKVVHWLALAQVHQQREDPLGAIGACEPILSINPNDVVALIYSYDALLAWGNIPAAKERLSQLIALAGDDLRVLQRQIEHRCQRRWISGKAGKLTKKLITAALHQAPQGAEVRNLLAYYHILRGDWAQGVKVLAEFTAEHPKHPYGWYFYGQCLFETGNFQQAAKMMGKAYRLYAEDCAIHQALCDILPAAKQLEALRPVVEEMLQQFPDRWSVQAKAGRVWVEQFQAVERGCRVSEQGTILQPHLAAAWLCHGRVLALAGKHQQAVESLEKGRALLPTGGYLQLVPGLVWLGESYQVLGEAEASQRYWEAAGEGCRELQAFNPAVAAYWLGRALVGLGERVEAIQVYDRALSQQLLYPARGEVEKIMRRLKDRRRKGYRG